MGSSSPARSPAQSKRPSASATELKSSFWDAAYACKRRVSWSERVLCGWREREGRRCGRRHPETRRGLSRNHHCRRHHHTLASRFHRRMDMAPLHDSSYRRTSRCAWWCRYYTTRIRATGTLRTRRRYLSRPPRTRPGLFRPSSAERTLRA